MERTTHITMNRRTERKKKPAAKKEPDYKQRLLEMKKEIISQIPETSGRETHESGKEVDDDAALASNEARREVLLLLTVRNREKLRAIEEALKKIEGGTFGTCEECGEQIEPARLKAMPLAKFCLDCQSQLEKETKLQKGAEARFPIPIEEDEAAE